MPNSLKQTIKDTEICMILMGTTYQKKCKYTKINRMAKQNTKVNQQTERKEIKRRRNREPMKHHHHHHQQNNGNMCIPTNNNFKCKWTLLKRYRVTEWI